MGLGQERLNLRKRSYRLLVEKNALEERDRIRRRDYQVRHGRVYSAQSQSANPVPPLTQDHYRRAADTFISDADGVVQVWNGIDKPRRFDAGIGSYETAGVIAPTQAVQIGSRGAGNIVGTYYAFARFVDRSGNFSSLSPISVKFEASSGVGSVTAASNESPIILSCGNAGSLANGQVIKVEGITGNTAANGIFSVQRVTSGTVALYLDSTLTTPSAGNGAYVSGGKVTTGVGTIVYSNVPVSSESKVVRRQVLRNQDGDASVFYVDVDTTDLTSTSLESNTTSDSLVESVSLTDSSGHTLVDKTVPPDYKKVVAFHLGRVFAAGNENYSEGAVTVTNGSTTVTGIGTEWGPITFANRFFEVVGGTKRYQIANLTSPTSLQLTEPYQGSTDHYAYYSIHVGDGERRTMYWSEGAQPEAWPLENTLTLAEDPGAGEITTLFTQNSWLYIGAENRIYRFSFVNDPLTDGFVVKAARRGCVNNRCWVQAEDVTYCMDTLGFHAFAGNDDVDIGTPGIQDIFRNRPDSKYRINWPAKRNFHAVYEPGECTIRWFVCLGGYYTPYHAVCYHVRLKRWWIEEYPFPISSSCLGRLSGKPQVYLGTSGKRIMAFGTSVLDGIDPSSGDYRGSVTSSGVNWVADSSATFSTSLIGTSVSIVRGKGKGQRRTIYSVSGTKVYVKTPWTDRPDTTSVYQIGAVGWTMRTGWYRWAHNDNMSQRAVSIQFKPTAETAEMYLRQYSDLASTPETWINPVTDLGAQNGIGFLENDPDTDLSIDTTKVNGFVCLRNPQFREHYTDGPRYVSLEIGGYANADQMTLFRVVIDGAQ